MQLASLQWSSLICSQTNTAGDMSGLFQVVLTVFQGDVTTNTIHSFCFFAVSLMTFIKCMART